MSTELIFMDYDQAGLDRQYNNRAQVPEHVQLYESWEPLCAQVLEDFDHHRDTAYGASPRETLDIIRPAGPGPHPVHLYIHGGYWMSRTKSDQTFLARPYVAAGGVFVLVEYDLMPEVRMADIVRQCRSAVAWVHAHAGDYGIDAERITVSGHSAGGHLTAMLAATDWPAFCDGPEDMVKAGCAVSGIFELQPIRLTYMQETLGLTAEEVSEFSPVRFDPAPGVPLDVVVGGAETDEFRRQSKDFTDTWNERGGACSYLERPGCNHFTILADFADPESATARAIMGQMGVA